MWKKVVICCEILCCWSPQGWTNDETFQLDTLIDLSLSELQEIQIDSATKISQPLNSIPANVSIFTRADIRNYGFRSFNQLLRNLPGIYIEEDTEEIYIGTRGSIGGSVQLLVNGVPQHPSLLKGLSTVETNRLNIPVSSIDRIEFIRGPMAVVYGNNAFQGTLNIVTQKSHHSLAKIAVGDDDSGELFGRLYLPFRDGNLGVNIGASNDGSFSGNYRDQLGQSQLSSLNQFTQNSADNNLEKSLRSIDINLSWHGLTASFSYQQSRYPFFPSVPPTGENELDLETWIGSIEYTHAIDQYWQSKSLLISSEDRYKLDEVNILNDETFGFQVQRSKRVEFEQVFTHQQKNNNNLLIGYRAQQIRDAENRALVQAGPSTPAFVDRSLKNYTIHELFSQYQHNLTKSWGLVLGLRYTALPNEYEFTNTSALNERVDSALNTEDQDLINYRLAVLFEIDSHHNLKFLHGSASQDNESFQISKPESIRTTEIVHNYSRSNWLLTQSVYYSTTRHVLRRDVSFDNESGAFISRDNNDGRWRSHGYDLTIDYELCKNWRISGSFNIQKTRDLSVDENIGYSPNQLFKLRTNYRYNNNTFAFYGHYVGKRDSELIPEDTDSDQEPDTLTRRGQAAEDYWNLGVNWRYDFHKSISANLNISNLLDEEFRYPANEVSNLERGLIGVGRVVTLSLESRW